MFTRVCASGGGSSLACLGVFLRDSRTEACSFRHIPANGNLEVLGAIKTRLYFITGGLYEYFMAQTCIEEIFHIQLK